MPNRSTRALATSTLAISGFLGFFAGCSGSTSQAAAPRAPKAEPALVAPAHPRAPKQRLLEALRGLERPGPVLDALDPAALSLLDVHLRALSPQEHDALLKTELAEQLPLLHLRAGGTSPNALYVLATTPAALLELAPSFEPPSG